MNAPVASLVGDAGGKDSRGSAAAAAAAAAAASILLSSAGGSDVIRRRTDPDLRGLVLQHLCVITPSGPGRGFAGAAVKLLATDLSLVLEPGQSLLVVGPSGCGKSSLMRAIAGLWTAGSGTVVLPGSASPAARGSVPVFFLPQKPFMPLGDLRTQLTFPGAVPAGAQGDADRALRGARGSRGPLPDVHERTPLLAEGRAPAASGMTGGGGNGTSGVVPSTAASETAGGDCTTGGAGRLPLSDEELLTLLDDVCLPDLVQRVGGLDVELDWSSVLSVGEQQRVAVLRLLAAGPTLAFLDEATSALDGPTEGRLYGLIRKRIGCYVSVGHRMQLLQHHTHVLECLGGGMWRLDSSAEYQHRMAIATGLHP
ncbi:hypothetical protein Vretimale_16104 [Volvox reticuliferus]|nr:hypothetical protein Vretifemale_9656 [Volvox reticuliferus]GIM12875.1 hypothetical protein Vretimale_16104 [Volvox reticuliferus]